MPMTADEFRKLALAFPGAVESAHMNHPDFRVGGKIFATLGAPDEAWGMIKLTPEKQRAWVEKSPGVFKPCQGAWGQGGATYIHLRSARKAPTQAALATAWKNVVTSQRTKRKPSPKPGNAAAAIPLTQRATHNRPPR